MPGRERARYDGRMRLRFILPQILLGALVSAAAAPRAQPAGLWPYQDNRDKHSAISLHNAAQHPVRPVGVALHAVKPVGTPRKAPPLTAGKKP